MKSSQGPGCTGRPTIWDCREEDCQLHRLCTGRGVATTTGERPVKTPAKESHRKRHSELRAVGYADTSTSQLPFPLSVRMLGTLGAAAGIIEGKG